MERTQPRILLVEGDQGIHDPSGTSLWDELGRRFHLERVKTADAGLFALGDMRHDVCLLDSRACGKDGGRFLEKAKRCARGTPIIVLTDGDHHEEPPVSVRAGAFDCLDQKELSVTLLDRVIRHALKQKQLNEALRRSEARLSHVSTRLVDANENERRRIAKELHDSVSQSLAAINFCLETIREKMEQGEHRPSSLTPVIAMVQFTMEEVHRITMNLRPSLLDDVGLKAALQWFCREFDKTYPNIKIDREFNFDDRMVREGVKIAVFRIAQEALSNAAKHSHGSHVKISLVKEESSYDLMIRDNGVGFSFEEGLSEYEGQPGMGLSNIQERARSSGGTCLVESAPNCGTMIRVTWPRTHFDQLSAPEALEDAATSRKQSAS